MGLKRLSRNVLFSLAAFAGLAELRAHAAPLGEVSPNLTVVQKQAPLQQKKNAHGFSAYLKQSAKSLGASFVAAVKAPQSDRALAMKKSKRVLGAHRSAPKTAIVAKTTNFHEQQAALSAIQHHEDLSRTACVAASCWRSAGITGLQAAKQLWIFRARPPNSAEIASFGRCPTLIASTAKPSPATTVASGASNQATCAPATSGNLGAHSAAIESHVSQRVLSPAGLPGMQSRANAHRAPNLPGNALVSAPADSKGLNPPINHPVSTLEALSGQFLPSLG